MLPSPTETNPLPGLLAGFATVVLWAAGLALTRFGVVGSLTVWDVMFLRMCIPALLLWPILLRQGIGFGRGHDGSVVVMLIGAGLPFITLSTIGFSLAPVAHAGAFMPGTMPLFAALLSWLVLGEKLSRDRLAGFGLILLGAGAIAGYHILHSEHGVWRGHLLFVCSGFMWASFTVAMRRSGFGAWHATALIYCSAALLFAPVYLVALPSNLANAPPFEIIVQLLQSVLTGVLSLYLFGLAVGRLGAGRAAAFAALTPVIAALLGIPLLHEWPEPITWAGILLVASGVALASGAAAMLLQRHRMKAPL